jgi:hypothetical protein
LSNQRPQIAAVVVINIVSVLSGVGIIAGAVAIAVAVSPIAIVAIIVNVALLTLLRHPHQNGGGQVSLVLILRIPMLDIWQGRLWFVETSVFGDHDTPHQQMTNAKFNNKPLMKKGQNKRGGTENADDHGTTSQLLAKGRVSAESFFLSKATKVVFEYHTLPTYSGRDLSYHTYVALE